jgi:hypothetical protein
VGCLTPSSGTRQDSEVSDLSTTQRQEEVRMTYTRSAILELAARGLRVRRGSDLNALLQSCREGNGWARLVEWAIAHWHDARSHDGAE